MSTQTTLNFSIRKRLRSENAKIKVEKENSGFYTKDRIKVKAEQFFDELGENHKEADVNSKNQTPRALKSRPFVKRSQSTVEETEDENKTVSPPKRERKDSSSSPKTPSQFLLKLSLNSPNAVSPSLLKEKENEKHFTPKRLFGTAGLTYQQARQALHSSVPTSMVEREKQMEHLKAFLEKHLESNTSGTLYVSGPPGTGKTACLTKIMELPELKQTYKTIHINCTSMKSSSCIYSRIAQELSLKVSKKNEKEYRSTIERHLNSHNKMTLLVLDEIDQLDSRNQSILYTVFEWPSKPNAKLVLIGIANALDLTDRILPRLQARLDLKPELLHFPPYTKQQIVNILTKRLTELGVSDLFPPAALHLLAAKVAAMSGDIRKALDIARRAVELAEIEKSSQPLPLQPLTDNLANTASPKKSSPRKNQDHVTVALKEVMSVLNSVYATSHTLHSAEHNANFPLQQKVLICTLLLILKKGRNKDVTVGKLHEVYKRVCKKRSMCSLEQGEFYSLCQLVETRGIMRLQTSKEIRLAKICLQWDEEEVSAALQDKNLLGSILNDTACLS